MSCWLAAYLSLHVPNNSDLCWLSGGMLTQRFLRKAARALKSISLMCSVWVARSSFQYLVLGQGFQGYDVSILRIVYLVPRICVCLVFSCLAILRIEGCLNSAR